MNVRLIFSVILISFFFRIQGQTLYVPEADGQTPGIYKSINTNVGIGTPNPISKLDVNGGYVRITNTGETDIHYIVDANQWEAGTNSAGNGTGNNQFFFYDTDYRLTIQRGTGNVGIGTRWPSARLSILRQGGIPSIKAVDEGGSSGYVIIDGFTSGKKTENAVSLNHYIDGEVWLAKGGGNVSIGTDPLNSKLTILRTPGLPSLKAANENGNNSGYVIIDGYGSGSGPDNAVSLNHYINGDVWLAAGGGKVGIGTDNPNAKLSIRRPSGLPSIKAADEGGYGYLIIDGFKSGDKVNNSVSLNHYVNGNVLLGMGGGYVGIGIDNPKNLLDVKGTIHAQEVKVDMNNWSDFVFHPSYQLKPLMEVEKFIKANGHLHDIPSAAEVEQNGVNVGEMQKKLLQKVEELTLYVIELKKEIEQLKQNQK